MLFKPQSFYLRKVGVGQNPYYTKLSNKERECFQHPVGIQQILIAISALFAPLSCLSWYLIIWLQGNYRCRIVLSRLCVFKRQIDKTWQNYKTLCKLVLFFLFYIFSSFQLGNQSPAKQCGSLISFLEILQPLLSLYCTILALNYTLPCNN